MSHVGMPRWGPGTGVSWHALDSDEVEAVARFIAHGWAQSEHALVIASPAHRLRIEAATAQLGADPELERAQGRYLAVDADETLRRFVVDGVLDPRRFRAVVTDVLGRASSDGSHVRVFSELIALLWQGDDVQNALDIELQWRFLLRRHDFSLLCAYPTADFAASGLVDVRRVCDLHTDLAVGESTRVGADTGAPGGPVAVGRYHACSQVYLPVAESVPSARHFVVDVLRAWGMDHLDGDAAIVISELATNALRHAETPFRVVLDRQQDGVRLGVEDAARNPLARRSPSSYDLGGRGVDIVEALSRRWGWTELPSGKLVWADLVEAGATSAAAASEG
ncbi:MAG TPA: MEDS domain-containing protein [Humibacillus xanthopallidus]|nr:MEDS domain-containing protein [Humibacillus xanthopallidus]